MVGSRRSQRNGKRKRSSSSINFNYYDGKTGAVPKTLSKSAMGLAARARAFAGWLGFRIILIAAASAVIYWGLTLNSSAKLVIGGGQYRAAADYQRVVDSYISSVFDRTKLTFDSDSIVNALKHDFPEVDSATVELPIVGRSPVVRLDVSSPAAVLETDSDKFVMSSAGLIIDKTTNLLPIKGLPIVRNESGVNLGSGSVILSGLQVDFIRAISAQARRANINIDYFTLPTTARELDMHVKKQGYRVKLDLSRDPLEQMGSYIAASKYLNSRHISISQYIDVRVAGKIYYR